MLTTLLTTTQIFLTCFATLFIPITLVSYGRKYALAVWAAALLLSIAFVPNKLICLGFGILGLYAVIKSSIEQIRNIIAEWAIKIAVYLIVSGILFFVFPDFSVTVRLTALGIGGVVFVIYDAALSMGISFCTKKMKNILKK